MYQVLPAIVRQLPDHAHEKRPIAARLCMQWNFGPQLLREDGPQISCRRAAAGPPFVAMGLGDLSQRPGTSCSAARWRPHV
jgi:hypothetical protein